MEVRDMAEKQYKYTARIKQPQTVVNVKLDPKGGALSEREYKALKKDAYGASLLEKGLLVVTEVPAANADPEAKDAKEAAAASDAAAADATAASSESGSDNAGETVPDFDDGSEKKGGKRK
jgi:hypothetical protein